MKDHRLIDERSLAFDRLTAAKITADPAIVDRARATVARWLQSSSPRVRPVLHEWRAILDGPREELLAALARTDEHAARLRQSSPFAGVLSPAERTAILREFRQRESAAA
jgi:hypothetical protein